MSNPPSLYLGENITITDSKDEKGSYKTIFNAPNTKIIDESEQTVNLIVTGSATFNNVPINNVGIGVKDTDAVIVKQLSDEINRAQKAESELISSINTLTVNLNNEINRSTTSDTAILAKLDDINSRIDFLYEYFFKDKSKNKKK